MSGHETTPPDKLLILGQSLGRCGGRHGRRRHAREGIRGIAAESAFDSYREIAKDKAPDLLARLSVSDGLSPRDVVARLSPTPILFIHGTADRVVPYARGKALFAAAKEPKTLWTIRGGRHTEAFTRYGTIYRPRLVTFFRDCVEDAGGR